jgi:hypothetical protein
MFDAMDILMLGSVVAAIGRSAGRSFGCGLRMTGARPQDDRSGGLRMTGAAASG